MKKKLRFAILFAAAMCCLTTASAVDPCHKLFGYPVPDCIGKWCHDDYCPKQQPCVSVPLCFGCDDYCAKKVPCVSAPLGFSCDDYCKKCLPTVCSKPLDGFLRCGLPGGGCGCSEHGGSPCDSHLSNHVKAELATPDLAPKRIATKLKVLEDATTEQPVRLPPVFVRRTPFQVTE